MDLLKDLFVQLAIIVAPIFIYEIFWLNKYHATAPSRNRFVMYLCSLLSLVLCLIYPLYTNFRVSISFEMIIIMSATLYGGFFVGVMLLAVAANGVALFFPTQLSMFILLGIIFFIVSYIISFKWSEYSNKSRLIIVLILSSSYITIDQVSKFIYFQSIPTSWVNKIGVVGYIEIIIFFIAIMMLQVFVRDYIYENAIIRVQTQKSEKLKVVSELAASVAHEVRNPLTVVRGFIQLMSESESGTNRQYLDLVLSELDRAENIITDYLNLARPQLENQGMIDLTQQLHEITTIMSSYATLKGVVLHVSIDEGLYIVGEKLKIKQAMINILKNGVEAITEKKGTIKIVATQRNNQIIIKVKDTGAGMSKEQRERLGQPFYSLKEKGTGLGLMVTFRIIEAHEGTISYDSEVGKGTEVTIAFPAVSSNSETSSLDAIQIVKSR